MRVQHALTLAKIEALSTLKMVLGFLLDNASALDLEGLELI